MAKSLRFADSFSRNNFILSNVFIINEGNISNKLECLFNKMELDNQLEMCLRRVSGAASLYYFQNIFVGLLVVQSGR